MKSRRGIPHRPRRTETRHVTRHKTPIDNRPFQARAVLEQQQMLEALYGRIAIDEVAAALQHVKPTELKPQPTVSKAA